MAIAIIGRWLMNKRITFHNWQKWLSAYPFTVLYLAFLQCQYVLKMSIHCTVTLLDCKFMQNSVFDYNNQCVVCCLIYNGTASPLRIKLYLICDRRLLCWQMFLLFTYMYLPLPYSNSLLEPVLLRIISNGYVRCRVVSNIASWT